MVQRIRIVGTTGAGKTHLARAVAARLNLPHLELDALQHQPGWQPASDQDFAAGLQRFLATAEERGGWVVDGNYNDRAGELLAVADTVVWLDYPRWVVMARIVRRSVGRVLLRRQLWNGNRERLATLLSTNADENVVLWAWTQHLPNRRRYDAALRQPSGASWVRLRTPGEARRWLRAIPPAAGSAPSPPARG